MSTNNSNNDINGASNIATVDTKDKLLKEATQRDLEDYKAEYEKIQEDINTLRLVLNEKLKREQELKTLLGITFVDEIKQDFQEGFNHIKQATVFVKVGETLKDLGTTVTQNDAYQKTAAGFKSATQKITPAFQSIGSSFKTKLGDVRNSNVFKSVEGRMGFGFGGNNKMKSSQSEYTIDDDLGSGLSNTNGLSKAKTQEPIAEEKPDKI